MYLVQPIIGQNNALIQIKIKLNQIMSHKLLY